jgi:hypothetical protein
LHAIFESDQVVATELKSDFSPDLKKIATKNRGRNREVNAVAIENWQPPSRLLVSAQCPTRLRQPKRLRRQKLFSAG